jgi:hypothetical protein
VELKPLPPPDWTPLDGAWKPLLDELLLDPSDELLDEPADPADPLEPEPDVEPPDELELDDELLPVLVTAAWLEPGRIAATTPATATLAKDTVTVVALSRRRPCSRSATARATCRPAPWSDVRRGPAAGSSQLFTLISLARTAVSAVGEVSADVLSTQGRGLRGRVKLPVFSNAQRRLSSRFRPRRAPRGA